MLLHSLAKAHLTIALQSAIAAMSSVRRLHYSGLVWRFHFLIAATLLTSAVTAVGFILGRVAEGQYKWDDDISVDYSAGLMVRPKWQKVLSAA